jgi:hypothetical protein
MGGIAGALASHADSVLHGLSSQGHSLARAVLLRLVTPERTRAIVSLEELRRLSRDKGELGQIINQLVQARLLVVQTGGGATGATVELVHESLIHGWPTLKRWLDEGQEDSAFLEQLRNAARQWQAKHRDSGLLWRGEMVEEARRFQRRYRGELPEAQQEFLAAVFAQAARTTRGKRTLAVGSIVFLSLLVAASAVALVVIREEQKRAELNEAVAQLEKAQAISSKQEATESLKAAQAKEIERQDAIRKLEAALAEIEATNARLQGINSQLKVAVEQARQASWKARRAEKRASLNAAKARQAEKEALERAEELRQARERDRKRIEELGEIVPSLLRRATHEHE